MTKLPLNVIVAPVEAGRQTSFATENMTQTYSASHLPCNRLFIGFHCVEDSISMKSFRLSRHTGTVWAINARFESHLMASARCTSPLPEEMDSH